jgi:hypothetical protein
VSQLYPIHILGKRFLVTIPMVGVYLLVALAIIIIGSLGIFKFGGWLGLLAAVLLTGSVTKNGKVYTLIPHEFTRKLFTALFLWSGVGYFFFG